MNADKKLAPNFANAHESNQIRVFRVDSRLNFFGMRLSVVSFNVFSSIPPSEYFCSAPGDCAVAKGRGRRTASCEVEYQRGDGAGKKKQRGVSHVSSRESVSQRNHGDGRSKAQSKKVRG
jgi:hypothetical protein